LPVGQSIQKNLIEFSFKDRDNQQIPAPTISQGFAIFPFEARERFELIELANPWYKPDQESAICDLNHFSKRLDGAINTFIINPVMGHKSKTPRSRDSDTDFVSHQALDNFSGSQWHFV
jgi:hypothetical protein